MRRAQQRYLNTAKSRGRGRTRAGGALYIRFAFNIPSQEDEFNVETLDGTYASTSSLGPLSIVWRTYYLSPIIVASPNSESNTSTDRSTKNIPALAEENESYEVSPDRALQQSLARPARLLNRDRVYRDETRILPSSTALPSGTSDVDRRRIAERTKRILKDRDDFIPL